MHAGKLIFCSVVVNMPRKHKPRKPVAPPDEAWIAPRPANRSEPRIFEPAGAVRSNRYLEFADIALGAKKQVSHRKNKSRGAAILVQHENAESKVTPINHARVLRFGAFRGPR